MKQPNIVFILTDTQSKCMVGAYGAPQFRTPRLDELAASGMRFERAYTACPLCTPARGAMFSGMWPANNGAWANEMSPMRHVPLAGEVFRALGYRAAHTGKWHLDGAGYHGGGNPDGGFESDWWYDGARYLADIGQDRHRAMVKARSDAAALRALGVTAADIWRHRVADRAIDFLERVGDERFLLVVSFDEPHGPFVVPPAFADAVDPATLPRRPNFGASLAGKPQLQQRQAAQYPVGDWPDFVRERAPHWNCNAYVDSEIGRVVDAVRRRHGDDTFIVYTADHGDMMGSHGLRSKGAMMYEETVNVPFIVTGPGIAAGSVSRALVSHLDLLPTFLAWAGKAQPAYMPGVSLLPVLANPSATVREVVSAQYNRFGLYHDGNGDFCQIRCLMDGRYKLVVNLSDTDEFYDLENDPFELCNLIAEPSASGQRDALHDRLLAQMDAVSDPLRGDGWRNRPWRTGCKTTPYFYQPTRPVPAGLLHGRPTP
jgi:uncharacterized sulfatase